MRPIFSFIFSFLLIVFSLPANAQTQVISVPFNEGFIGTVGTSSGKANNIITFDTLGVAKAYFSQETDNGFFGGTQGNDYDGTVRLIFDNGRTLDIPGAVNWRETDGNTLNAIGFIPSPTISSTVITYGAGSTYTISATSNFGLKTINSSAVYTDGQNVSGNAATSGLLDALNEYLAYVNANKPSGPVTVDSFSTKNTTPNLTGMVTLSAGETLSISINGITYTTSDGLSIYEGVWSLAIPVSDALSSGTTYDVSAVIENAGGFVLADTTLNEVEILPAASALTSEITALPSAISADGQSFSTVTVQLKDANGANLTTGGDTVELSASVGTLGIVNDNGDGTYSADLTSSTTPETATISGTVNGSSISDTAEVEFVTIADVTRSTLSANKVSTPADGSSLTTITLELVDASGTPVAYSNGVVTMSNTSGTLSAVTDNGDGTYTAILTSASSPSVAVITAYIEGTLVTDTVSVEFLETVPPSIISPDGQDYSDGAYEKSVNSGVSAVGVFTASEEVTWSMESGIDSHFFQIDPSTGALRFIASPDYDAPADDDTNNVYILNIRATDSAGNYTIQAVTVTVLPVDLLNPVITGPVGSAGDASVRIELNEGIQSVGLFAANENVTWSITSGEDIGSFVFAGNELTFNFIPDYEFAADSNTDNVYTITITATDLSNNTSTQDVEVVVLNLPEDSTPPSIIDPNGNVLTADYEIDIPETQLNVGTFGADEQVSWSIDSGADATFFSIDPATGALRFINLVDYDNPQDTGTNNTYEVIVRAEDNSENFSLQKIIVTILSIDTIAPVITGPVGEPGDEAIVISINEGVSEVGLFSANENVVWSIDGNDFGAFTLANGVLSFAITTDYENPADLNGDNTYEITMWAYDDYNNAASQIVQVVVMNLVDEEAPVITTDNGDLVEDRDDKVINENQTEVASYNVSENVSWAISGGLDADQFEFNPITGTLSFKVAPKWNAPSDTDGNNVYEVELTATDDSGNKTTITVVVEIAAPDIDPPIITTPDGDIVSDGTNINIEENGTEVMTFVSNESVSWSVSGGADADLFEFDPLTGTLSFISAPSFGNPLDSDRDNIYTITLVATDDFGNETPFTVTVTILQVDFEAPEVMDPSGNLVSDSASLEIEEGQISVGAFTSNETVKWSIVSGVDSELLSINEQTGVLTFNSAPDYESPLDHGKDNIYILQIQAVDESGNITTITLRITVISVTDTPEELFAEKRDDIRDVIQDEAVTVLDHQLSVNENMTRDARERLISHGNSAGACQQGDEQSVSNKNDEESCIEEDIPFDIDGNVTLSGKDLNGSGTFFGKSKAFISGYDKLVSGDYNFTKQDNGTTTGTINGRLSFEKIRDNKLLTGYFVGGAYSKSDISGEFSGDGNTAEIQLGAYSVYKLKDNLYAEGFASLGYGLNNLDIADDELGIKGDYSTASGTIGGALSGVMDYGRMEIWPTAGISYGHTKIGNIDLEATAFDETAEVTLNAQSVSITKLRFEPEFRYSLGQEVDSTSLVSLTPEFMCQSINTSGTTRSCGYGIDIGLQLTSKDDRTRFNTEIGMNDVGKRESQHFKLSLEHRF